MTSISILFSLLFSLHNISGAVASNGVDPVQITIIAKESADELFVDVSNEADGTVTLSIFSEIGEIVITERLVPGTNRVKVRHLRPGQYVAVVRHNDEFRQKQVFNVN
jgi:hypothetical protein